MRKTMQPTSGPRALPEESQTARILEQIYPQSPPAGASSEIFSGANSLMNSGYGRPGAHAKLVQFGRSNLDRLSTLRNAFKSYVEKNFGLVDGRVPRSEFCAFLSKYCSNLPAEEHNRVFDLLDVDRRGSLSVADFNRAVDAVAPLESLDHLRQRWLALGFASMQQALNAMRESEITRRRLSFSEFAQALTRVGVEDPKEHAFLFRTISDPREDHNGHGGVTLEQLASAVAVVSPALLVEDLRDRIQKQFGSVDVALQDMSAFTTTEFVQWATRQFSMTRHEAVKLYRLINIRGHERIGPEDFTAALSLCRPSLQLEEARRKLRKWAMQHDASGPAARQSVVVRGSVSRESTGAVRFNSGDSNDPMSQTQTPMARRRSMDESDHSETPHRKTRFHTDDSDLSQSRRTRFGTEDF
jgi:hypothetical protein